MADNAASVGSLIFFGVFAISVAPRTTLDHGSGRKCVLTAPRARWSENRLRVPLGQPAVTRRARAVLPLVYPIGLAYQMKLVVNVSLIIVNVPQVPLTSQNEANYRRTRPNMV